MAIIQQAFRYRRFLRMTTTERTTATWGGTAGYIPKGVLVWDTDLKQLWIGDATPESAPDTGTAGGLLVGPIGLGANTSTTTQVLFNDAGVIGGDAGMTYAKATDTLTVGSIASHKISEIVGFTGVISPTGLTGTTNNYNPTNLATAGVIRLSSSGGDRTLTGITAPTGSIIDGRMLILVNADPDDTISITNEGATSDAANRFLWTSAGGGNPLTHIRPNAGVTLMYDSTSSRWRVIGSSQPSRHYHANAGDGGQVLQSKSVTIMNPTSSDDATVAWFAQAVTITKVVVHSTGGTSSDFNLKFASTRDSGSPTSVWSTAKTVSSASGTTYTTFDNANITADYWLWADMGTISGSVTQFHATIFYNQVFGTVD